ncbi:MAG: ComEC/Rec2 family competence protein, partial [Clostridia bacterium]|nr:ComEC/Rec2 family competence protein [Clostridia bacterium]
MIALLLASIISLLYFDYYIGSATEWYGKTEKMRVEIIDVNYNSPYSSYADVRILKIGNKKVNFKARLECGYSIDASRGEIFTLKGTFSDFENDPIFNSKRYYNSKGYYLNIVSEENTISYIGKSGFSLSSMFKDINEFCESRLMHMLDTETFGFANGIFLGNRENIDAKLNRDFTELGISHMIAISGMHLTILIGSIYSMLLHFGVHRKITVCISITICVFYVGMTGATPAILRSGIMFIIMSLSTILMRENDSMTSLFATAGVIVFFMPNAIFDAAFLLSCFSTFGILLIFPWLKRFSSWSRTKCKIVSVFCGVLSGFIVTIFATVFTLPLTIYYFGRFYYLLPLTNLIFELPTTLILMLSPFVVVFSFVPYIGTALAYLCKLITLLMSFLADLITSLDVGSVSLSYPFVSVFLILFIAVVLIMIVLEVKNPLWIFLPFAVSVIYIVVCQDAFLQSLNS